MATVRTATARVPVRVATVLACAAALVVGAPTLAYASKPNPPDAVHATGGRSYAFAASVPGPSAGHAIVTTAGAPLNERSGPTTAYARIGRVADRASVTVMCERFGQMLAGNVATSALWDLLSSDRYVPDGFLSWHKARPAVPWCGVTKHRAVTATVATEKDPLSVRSRAKTLGVQVGTLAKGTVVAVRCHVWGRTVSGTQGSTATWSRLSKGHYLPDAYLAWSPDRPNMPWCGEGPATVAPRNGVFITQSVAPARASMTTYRVPAAVTIAQAILESGWGHSSLTTFDHNYFGMKCFGDPGTIAVGCRGYATHECGPKGCYPTTASFRAYRGSTDSFGDHGRLLATLSRYRNAFQYVNDPDKFAHAIQNDGYATSPVYADNLIAIMKKYNLYRYD